MNKQNFSKNKVSFFTACDIIKSELEKEERTKLQAKRAKTIAHCQLFNKVSDLLADIVEFFKNGDGQGCEISAEDLDLFEEIEMVTGSEVNAGTTPAQITTITRMYLEITQQ